MAQLSKNALISENNNNFPNNNTGYITPELLRNFNQDMIDSTVNQTIYDTDKARFDAFTASASSSIEELFAFSSSLSVAFVTTAELNAVTGTLLNTASFNAYSSAVSIEITNLEITTQSIQDSLGLINAFTQSANGRLTNLEITSASVSQSIRNLNLFTASVSPVSTGSLLVTASVINDDITFTKGDGSTFTIQVATGSFALSASFAETSSISRNLIVTARNGQASTLPAGTVVHITGAVGDNPIFTTASYDTEALSSNTLGILRYSSPAGADVEVVVAGILTGVDTDPALGYTAGDILYLSSSGQFTRVQPQAPNQIVALGQVLRAQQNNGSIYVSINNGWELDELHNVQITNPQTGDLIQYESASYGLWKNKSIAGAGITTTSSFNSYTSSNNQRVSSLEAATGSYATTGSNTFTGDQTLIDAGGNTITLSDTSGSLMLVAKGFTSASAHISSSALNKVNIIFKDNNNTGTTYISGSNNIFSNSDAPSAGFRRQLGANNVNLFPQLPQVSSSMADYVNIDSNFITARNTSPMTMRGPVSASIWEIKGNVLTQQLNIGTSAANHAQGLTGGLFVNNCYIGANLSIVANRSNTTQNTAVLNSNLAGAVTLNVNSSSIMYSNNMTAGGTTTVNNNTTGSARVTALNNAAFINSNYLGGNTTITLSGSNDPNDVQDFDYNGSVTRNLIHGSGISVRVNTGLTGSNTLAGTAIIGNGISVTGSSQNPVTNSGINLGSAFFGRYNAEDGNRALSAQTVFAVGTGTSTSARKTGFLIDSGSNAFVEGTLNVSGASTLNGNTIITGSLTLSSSAAVELNVIGNSIFTGSVAGNVLALSVTSNTASMDFNRANFFTLELPTGSTTHLDATNLQSGQTINLLISQNASATGSLTIAPKFKFSIFNSYTMTAVTGSKDILTFITFDNSVVYASSVKQLQ